MHWTETSPDKQFTPAPWQYAINGDASITKDGRTVCKRPPKTECTNEQWSKNANLMALSPELYNFIEAHLHLLPCDAEEEAQRLLTRARGYRTD